MVSRPRITLQRWGGEKRCTNNKFRPHFPYWVWPINNTSRRPVSRRLVGCEYVRRDDKIPSARFIVLKGQRGGLKKMFMSQP